MNNQNLITTTKGKKIIAQEAMEPVSKSLNIINKTFSVEVKTASGKVIELTFCREEFYELCWYCEENIKRI